MIFDDARAIADAVLFEGYALYPYRPSSPKNQLRFQFGVLAPRALEQGGLAPAAATPGGCRRRRCSCRASSRSGSSAACGSCSCSGTSGSGWDEGHLREIDFELPIARAAGAQRSDRGSASRRCRRTRPMRDALAAGRRDSRPRDAVPDGGAQSLLQITVRVENLTAGVAAESAAQRCAPRRVPGHAPAARRARRRLRLAHRSARLGDGGRRAVPQRGHLSGARRAAGPARSGGVRAGDPRRPSGGRAREPAGPLRRDRDRRDPHAARADADRRREGGDARGRAAAGGAARSRGAPGPRGDGAPARRDPRLASGGARSTTAPADARRRRRGSACAASGSAPAAACGCSRARAAPTRRTCFSPA